MVGPAGRLGKPKLSTGLGFFNGDDTTPTETPISSYRFNPPVLRNFSYPLNVGITSQPLLFPSPPEIEQTAWDQLGERYNFSPDSIFRARETKTPVFKDSFSFRPETESYSQVDEKDGNEDEELSVTASSEQLDQESLSQEDTIPRKKQRRSTLLNFTSTRSQDPSVLYKSAEKDGLKDRTLKLTKGQLSGDRIFPQTATITSRIKRNSSGQHKTTASLDTSRLITLSSSDVDRPASSSGVSHIDATANFPSITVRYAPLPLIISQESKLVKFGERPSVSQITGAMQSLGMDHTYRTNPPHENNGMDRNMIGNSGNNKASPPPAEPMKHKKKDGKRRWMSQLKNWVTASEPSAQALKQYKKETYDKAHISLDDPQANAKLHLPIAALPQNAIKPAGSGPDPEDIFSKRTERRKRLRYSGTGSSKTQGSKSSSSRYSISSSRAFGTAR
ncbi:uncharacterized protein F4812DRAFT_68283 [Daldinia caldariorum]|uniref:uncharacterized protein n=1 Tax=Daldinia caldariorum TaxID=326644 RepID=UPI002008DAB9|nr:uncharacterized protein F4812DRAFT_68283 [Daldinia caldariorum]KAI1466839.1 hypothetical protein F4812DRAFT_68283 [Daldinia caldariorum]